MMLGSELRQPGLGPRIFSHAGRKIPLLPLLSGHLYCFSLTFGNPSTTPQVCAQADVFCSKSKRETHVLSHFLAGTW